MTFAAGFLTFDLEVVVGIALLTLLFNFGLVMAGSDMRNCEFTFSYTKALNPVMALPMIRFCIWYVPS